MDPVKNMERVVKNKKRLTLILVAVVVVLMVGGVFWQKRGIPFVRRRPEQWSIGIYRGSSPFQYDSFWNRFNPILTADDVTDIPAKFVADPFLVKEGDTWFLFFEVYNLDTKQGDLSVASSRNLITWKYEGVILDEAFHLSYPYVFKAEGAYYLIPESYEDNSVRLYKAESFPTKWTYVDTLVEGRDYVDNSIVFYEDMWWLFSSVTTNDTLYLHYAESLTGPWQEHPASPVVSDDVHKARPSGRMMVVDGRLYRFTMDVSPAVGTHEVWAYEITELSTTAYAEEKAFDVPVLVADGSGWNEKAMHQLDPVQVGEDDWVASVDGFGPYLEWGWGY